MNKLKIVIFILVPIIIGLYTRFDDLKIWNQNKEAFYYKDRPIFTGNDSFYFARFGKEFFEGLFKAGEADPLRNVPDYSPYPDSLPLLSFISGLLAKVQGTYIENVSLWLVPILAVLFSVPLFLFFNRIGYPVAGALGGVVATISMTYLPRTTIARLDTDSLNLFFPFVVALFLLLTVESEGKKKYIYAALAGIFSNLYMMWYHRPSLLLSLTGAFIVYLLIDRKIKLRKEDFISIGIFVILANPLVLYQGIYAILNQLKFYIFGYEKKAIVGGFPNIQQFVTELIHYDFDRLSKLVVGNKYLFIAGLIGIAIVAVRRWKPIILILPFIVLGLIPLVGPMRFSMYLAPFVGVGLGAYFDEISKFIKKKYENANIEIGSGILFFAALTVLVLYTNKASLAFFAKPKYTPLLEEDFLDLSKLTEPNSWIWTWWSEGYMIEYLGNRATFTDPGCQFTPKTYFTGLTYSTSNSEAARNVIQSIASIGLKGINEEMERGVSPQQIKEKAIRGEYIKPEKLKNPIYWMFTIRSVLAFDAINKIGTWNFKMQNGLEGQYMFLGSCRPVNKYTIVCSRWIIDTKKGKVFTKRGKGYYIKELYLKEGSRKPKFGRYRDRGIYVEVVSTKFGTFGFMMQEQPFHSMYNQMYILRNYDSRYFELVKDHFPFAVLYRVKK